MSIRPIAQTMSNLKSKLLKPSLTSQYLVEIALPNGQGAPRLQGTQKDILELSCSETSLPGSALMTHELRDDYIGVTEKIAYRKAYDDSASFTFYVDTSHFAIIFFENWIRYISGEPLISSSFGSNNRPDFNHRMLFRSQYASKILIKKFEKDYGKQSSAYTEYTFLDAYPSSINSMPVSYDSSQLLKCTINFNFTRYLVRLNPTGNSTTQFGVDTTGLQGPASPLATPPVTLPANLGTVITNEYYNNFGDNTQNSTNFGDFTNGSNSGAFGQAIA